MNASAKGAKSAGGVTVGILPGKNPQDANPYIDIPIPTGLGEMRNLLIVRAAAALIAVGGGFGTLSEIALALKLSKPIAGIKTWEVSKDIFITDEPREAIQKVISAIKAR